MALPTITVNVSTHLDGFTYSLLPSVRTLIKNTIPTAHPANTLYVSFDTKSDFERQHGNLENNITLALLGLDSPGDLAHFSSIQFVDSRTGKVILDALHKAGKAPKRSRSNVE